MPGLETSRKHCECCLDINDGRKVGYKYRKTLTRTLLILRTAFCLSKISCSQYLDGDVTVGAPNDPCDSRGYIIMDGVGSVRTDVLRTIHSGEGGTDEI